MEPITGPPIERSGNHANSHADHYRRHRRKRRVVRPSLTGRELVAEDADHLSGVVQPVRPVPRRAGYAAARGGYYPGTLRSLYDRSAQPAQAKRRAVQASDGEQQVSRIAEFLQMVRGGGRNQDVADGPHEATQGARESAGRSEGGRTQEADCRLREGPELWRPSGRRADSSVHRHRGSEGRDRGVALEPK